MNAHEDSKEARRALRGVFWFSVLLLASPFAVIFVEIAWPSDIVFKTVNVVGCHRSVDGNQFEVVQTWNEDFYLLELVHTGPGGDRWRVALDGDCPKVWRCKLSASEDLRLLSVSAKGIVASYNWDRHELIRANGVVVHAYRTSR